MPTSWRCVSFCRGQRAVRSASQSVCRVPVMPVRWRRGLDLHCLRPSRWCFSLMDWRRLERPWRWLASRAESRGGGRCGASRPLDDAFPDTRSQAGHARHRGNHGRDCVADCMGTDRRHPSRRGRGLDGTSDKSTDGRREPAASGDTFRSRCCFGLVFCHPHRAAACDRSLSLADASGVRGFLSYRLTCVRRWPCRAAATSGIGRTAGVGVERCVPRGLRCRASRARSALHLRGLPRSGHGSVS